MLAERFVTPLSSVLTRAKESLIVREGAESADLWLWEHSERVMNLAQMLALLPEIGPERPDQTIVAVGALFHDAGWAVQLRQGRIDRWHVLSRPTNDLQRELGAGELRRLLSGVLDAEVIDTAAEAIRQCNDRYTTMVEAQVLAEAENLDEIGLMYVLRQFRQYQAEGRPLEQLILSWSRQLEYHYWDARINDCLRFPTSHRLARERLKVVEQFMSALAGDREAADLRRALRAAGIDGAADTLQPTQA
jgi:HD superfamily phosphodiesterase